MVGVFVHIPRTGGTSISEALNVTKRRNRGKIKRNEQYQGVVTFGHQRLPDLQKRGLAPEGAFTFTFCRNPYDRAVSLWAFNNEVRGLDLTFQEFCGNLEGWTWGKHIRLPQTTWADGVMLDFLGRFESMAEDFGALCDKLGIGQRELPHANASERGPWQEYYGGAERAIIREWYARDFERFGYDA